MKANETLRHLALDLAERVSAKYPNAAASLRQAAENFTLASNMPETIENSPLVTVHDKDGELLARSIIDLHNNILFLENFNNKVHSTV
jgi:hypothetical protein